MGGWEKVSTGCVSETVRCRKMILRRDIGLGVWLWSDLDLTLP